MNDRNRPGVNQRSLDCDPCEGGKEGGRRPQGADHKTRRPEGASAEALRSLLTLLITFARDLERAECTDDVAGAAVCLSENLEKMLSTLSPSPRSHTRRG